MSLILGTQIGGYGDYPGYYTEVLRIRFTHPVRKALNDEG